MERATPFDKGRRRRVPRRKLALKGAKAPEQVQPAKDVEPGESSRLEKKEPPVRQAQAEKPEVARARRRVSRLARLAQLRSENERLGLADKSDDRKLDGPETAR